MESFNRMVERLKENQESLGNYLESLESTNKQLKQAREELIRTRETRLVAGSRAAWLMKSETPWGPFSDYEYFEKGRNRR